MPIDPKFLISLNGREYPLYAGILAEAHARGLTSILTELVQIPTEENGQTAIVSATVIMGEGKQTFQDYGDASPRNTNARIATALIRMASTRAKGRALRDAINCGQTMLEELPDLEEGQAPSTVRVPAAPAGAGMANPPENGHKGGEHPLTVKCAGRRCVMAVGVERAERTTLAYGAPYCASCESLHEAGARGRQKMAGAEASGKLHDAKTPPMTCHGEGCGKAITKGQHDVSMGRFQTPLCPACQKALSSHAAAKVQA